MGGVELRGNPSPSLQPVPPAGSKGHQPPQFNVFFRVKFYAENINDLKFAQTRHLYYLQLRKDILGEGGLPLGLQSNSS